MQFQWTDGGLENLAASTRDRLGICMAKACKHSDDFGLTGCIKWYTDVCMHLTPKIIMYYDENCSLSPTRLSGLTSRKDCSYVDENNQGPGQYLSW